MSKVPSSFADAIRASVLNGNTVIDVTNMTDKRDMYKTARINGTDECVSVQHLGDNDYKVTFQSGSVAYMPAEENGTVYLTQFVL